MAVLKGEVTIIASEEDVVYSEDPDVTPDEKRRGCGWISVSDAQVRGGADVVRIRALTPGERGKFRGIYGTDGRGEGNRFAALRAVLSVNKKKGAAAQKWVDALAQQNALALDLLGARINQLSMGRPMEIVYADARQLLGYPELEEVDDDAASKSAAG